MTSDEWITPLWMACVALTASLLLVVLLRRPFRHFFGAERAMALWCLPLLAVLMCGLPHAAPATSSELPTVLVSVASVPAALPTQWVARTSWNVPQLLLALWLAGAVAYLVLLGMMQRRFCQRLGRAERLADRAGYSVWRAEADDVGPALVGAWRPRILLPSDFEQRYDANERELILCHEAMHACRRDGVLSLFAQLMLALAWFHPLAWWAMRLFRLDQELACDAAVLRVHPHGARCYAGAMLKTQNVLSALPVGCAWSPRHPLVERIALLATPRPSRGRRLLGRLVMLGLAGSMAGGVYAATTHMPPLFYPGAGTVEQALQAAGQARDAYARFVLSHGQSNTQADSNATLGLPAPDSGRFGPAVQRLEIVRGGHVLVTLRDGKGGAGGTLDFLWTGAIEGKALGWTCRSDDLPQIQQWAPSCRYVARHGNDHGGITLNVALGVNGQPPRLHATTCLRPGQSYQTLQGGVEPLPAWLARFSVKQIDSGQFEIAADLSGGSLSEPVHPRIRVQPGQAGAIQIGNLVAGKPGQREEDHTLRAELTASAGC